MWQLLEHAAKSDYVSMVQEKAHSIVATVQDEASSLLHALGTALVGPVDEIQYEEMEAYKKFTDWFSLEDHATDVTQVGRSESIDIADIRMVLAMDTEIHALYQQMVPKHISEEEFWSRYFFREHQEEERQRRKEERHGNKLSSTELDKVGSEDEVEHERSSTTEEKEDPEKLDTEDVATLKAELQRLRQIRDTAILASAQWKGKAKQLHFELQASKSQLEEDNAKNKELLKGLRNTYEEKMAQMLLQIDVARATGYDEGILKSEIILATIRQESESGDGNTESSLDFARYMLCLEEELRLVKNDLQESQESVRMLMEEKEQLQQENSHLKHSLQHETARLARASSAEDEKAVQEARKEIELWRARALKMRNAKTQIETELQTLQQQQKVDGPAGEMRQRIQELNEQLAVSNASLLALQHECFEKELKSEALRRHSFSIKDARTRLNQLRVPVALNRKWRRRSNTATSFED